MYHCVPDFEKDEDCLIPKSSVLIRPKESAMADQDDVVELLWQNGQVVLQSQTQRTQKRSTPADQSASRENPSHQHQHQDHLFMQEDEMASWLDYPLNDTNFDSDFCADLLYPTPCVTSATIATPPGRKNHVPASCPPTTTTASASKPPIPPPRTENRERTTCTVTETSTPPNSKNLMGRESTVVDSSDTPAERPESRVSKAMRSTEVASRKNNVHRSKTGAGLAITSSAGAGGDGGGGAGARDSTTIEMTVTSSPGGSSASAERSQKPPAEDRKRKGREADDECHSELKDVELESANVKKRIRGSTSTKRSRAAEVHNHSERRRRDRINEKMKALQELVPRCNKLFVHSDKASMLDEAIEYLKSLQLQVQMMSMWCGMVSMMFPGMQQYMPNMGMGVGMGMDMGMNRPMLPFPNLLAGSPLPTPPAAAHLGLRFPMPAVPGPDPSRIQTTNRLDPFNSFGMQNPNQPRLANFVDPCQQYLALHQTQLRLQQILEFWNQSMTLPSASKPSSSTGAENPANHPSGT